MQKISFVVFVAFLIFGLVCGQDDGILVKNAERNIDLTSQFARHSISFEFENTGSKAVEKLVLSFDFASSLSFLAVKDSNGNVLATTKSGSKNKADLYEVALKSSLKPKDSVKITVAAVFTHRLTPFPAEIGQSEKQFVIYKDNHYISSPYTVKTQKTSVKLASAKTEKRSELAPSSLKGDTLSYGPYENQAPFSSSEMSVHFESTKPILTATSLVREIEVSHWGNVAVEETYAIQHDGARLKGVFSRLEFQRNPALSSNAITVLTDYLPADAADVYYRDEIGNVTTSNLFNGPSGHVLQLGPRFPLFGGWKVGFYIGYNLPSYNYLSYDYNDRSRYVLNISFAPDMRDIVYDEVIVRIILPEGASNIEKYIPFPIDSEDSATHYTYLDTSGRPVVILKKKNVTPDHHVPFQVVYHFNSMSLLHEPILLVVGFFAVFLIIGAVLRFGIDIGSGKKVVNTAEIEVALSVVKPVFDARQQLVQELKNVVDQLKNGNGDEKEFGKLKSKVEQAAVKDAAKVKEALQKLKVTDAPFAIRLAELIEKQQQYASELVELGNLQQKRKQNPKEFKSKADERQVSVNQISTELEDIQQELF